MRRLFSVLLIAVIPFLLSGCILGLIGDSLNGPDSLCGCWRGEAEYVPDPFTSVNLYFLLILDEPGYGSVDGVVHYLTWELVDPISHDVIEIHETGWVWGSRDGDQVRLLLDSPNNPVWDDGDDFEVRAIVNSNSVIGSFGGLGKSLDWSWQMTRIGCDGVFER